MRQPLGRWGRRALRSPVRQAQIKDRLEPVGITYYYDLVRKHCEYSLDERITRLRRIDNQSLVARASNLGWSPEDVTEAISKQVAERRLMDEDVADRITSAAASALTLPTDAERLEALLSAIETERLTSIRDEICAGPPANGAAAVDDQLLDSDMNEEEKPEPS